jgi:hypothetical protein
VEGNDYVIYNLAKGFQVYMFTTHVDESLDLGGTSKVKDTSSRTQSTRDLFQL